MRRKKKLGHYLIEISRRTREFDKFPRAIPGDLQDLISEMVMPCLATHKLSAEHVLVIAGLFDKTISDTARVEPLCLLRDIYKDPHIVLEKLDLVLQLIESRIIDCDNKKYLKVKRKNNELDLSLDRSILVDVYICFTERFMTFVLGSVGKQYSVAPKPFRNNLEYVRKWFEYVDALMEARASQRVQDNTESLEAEAITIKKDIDERLVCTNKEFQFQKLIEDYSLSPDEQEVLMYVLKESLENNSPSEDELQVFLNNTKFDKYSKSSVLAPQAPLINEGLLVRSEPGFLSFGSSDFEVAPDIGSLILNGEKHSDIAIIQEILKYDDIFSIRRPAFTMAKLVLPETQKETVRQALSRYRNNSGHCLQDWGVLDTDEGDNLSVRGQDSARLRALLYGPPGTGKTALANAVASTLRRPLLYTDASKIVSKWVGDSEKQVAKLFSTYAKICKRTRRPPVLLFDEADQLISARGGVSRSVDRMYNQMQSIFLESLERFDGILIATTNLLDNIDEAFSRRFDIKLELSIPSTSQRKQLWKKIIPAKLPLSDDVKLNDLAKDYIFTGGQIKVVIRNAAVVAAARSGSNKVVRHGDLVKYAELEERNSFDSSTRKPIGFSSNDN